ncbi:MAG: glycosyltransferase [Verrucomicrobiaceae bacterium]|nr:MAG: glycosyltransferase [Verrucomicrobiaceae bacterium]
MSPFRKTGEPMISVVIPSYNRRDGMLALLGDLQQQEGIAFEIIVVDDGSPDDSVEAIRREFPGVKVLVNTRNSGPAVTRNRGIREAKGELIVGFDSDVTIPDPLLLAKVEARFTVSGVAGLALHILKADGKSEDVDRWWHPLPIAGFADRSFLTTYFSGTAYAFRKDAVAAAGLYPELLYMHYEEVELAWRVLDDGGEILYCPDLVAVHHANPVSRRNQVEVFLKPRNQILLAASCLPLVDALGYVLPRTGYQFIRACSGGHLRDFLSAMGSAVKLFPRQWSLRRPLRRETLGLIRERRNPDNASFFSSFRRKAN